jgi:3-oxoacyl-[acyl-carrier-protein] synthase III
MRRARRDWGNGALTVVAMAVVKAILAYGLTRTQINMAIGASTTSEPTTTGQGSTAPTGAPSGIAR